MKPVGHIMETINVPIFFFMKRLDHFLDGLFAHIGYILHSILKKI